MEDIIFQRIKKTEELLLRFSIKKSVALNGFLKKDCGYKSENDLPDISDGFAPFGEDNFWGGKKDSHAWFYNHIALPEEMKGEKVSLCVSTDISGWDACNPQFIAYINGVMAQGLDTNHREVPLPEGSEFDIYLYAYQGMIDGKLKLFAKLEVSDEEVEKLYYHFRVPKMIMEYLEEDSEDYITIREHLNNAINLLDFRMPESKEFYSSVSEALRYLEKELYEKYKSFRDVTVSCIGHTHIDVAWLWTLEQTAEKAQRSFSTVLNLMDRYPEYKFMSSQAKLYSYFKEGSPKNYERLKKRVAEGRFEVEGSMWVEADCNLTGGESLVRQILFGKRFFKKEFGVENKILWLPDVFGYSAALPQILRKSGVDKFVTSKISWNDTNKLPYDTFMWKGIDGTEVFTYFLTANNKKRGQKPPTYTGYNAETYPSTIAGTWERYQQKDINNEVLISFGYGDGGGGPTKEFLELLSRMKNGLVGCYKAKIETASDFLNRIYGKLKGSDKLPKWAGELYLEYHRGTYTSNAKNKRNNRKSELLFQNAEFLSVLGKTLLGKVYPQDKLNFEWEKILTNQFHDIIPGSSIKEVYDRCDIDYAEIKAVGNSVVEENRCDIINNLGTDGGIVVFNPNSFENSSSVNYNGKTYFAENIPSKGYKVLKELNAKGEVTVSEKKIENRFLKVTFDDKFNISSIFDKVNCREVIKDGQCANKLIAFEDLPLNYDAWEISSFYKEKKWDICDVLSTTPVFDGARAGFEIKRNFLSSTITQKIYLYDDISKIDFDTHIDWHEEHILLKAAFPVEINSTKATYDIQFGNVERPTHSNTSWDVAKFEVCAHKFADISEGDYGVSLMNDCKYGHDIHDGVMSLTLLKCPTHPYPDADKGEHNFIYSIYPHKGSFKDCDTVKKAYDLNNPLTAYEAPKNKGSLPDAFSFVSCDSDNIVIETIKKAEDTDDIIIRMYECKNARTNAKLNFGMNLSRVKLCDLMENDIGAIPFENSCINIQVKPFEIVTLKVSL